MYVRMTADTCPSSPTRLMTIHRLAFHHQRRRVAKSAELVDPPVQQLGRLASMRRMATRTTCHIHHRVGILERSRLLPVAALALCAEPFRLPQTFYRNFAVRVMTAAATHLAVIHRVMHRSRKLLRNIHVALDAELRLRGLQLVLGLACPVHRVTARAAHPALAVLRLFKLRALLFVALQALRADFLAACHTKTEYLRPVAATCRMLGAIAIEQLSQVVLPTA